MNLLFTCPGAGVGAKDVRELLKQYRQSKKMVKLLKGGAGSPKDMQKLMKKMQGAGKQVRYK